MAAAGLFLVDAHTNCVQSDTIEVRDAHLNGVALNAIGIRSFPIRPRVFRVRTVQYALDRPSPAPFA
jgi:hypothetical protein